MEIYLEKVTCCTCGLVFGIESTYDKKLVERHKTFYCPNGHAQSYVSETDAEKYKKQRDKKEEDCTELYGENIELQERLDESIEITEVKDFFKKYNIKGGR